MEKYIMITKRISLNEVQNDNYAKLFKFLFTDDFKNMSNDAKVLYCLLSDRMQLSIKKVSDGNNYWIDENGDIFIYATIDNIMELLNCAKEKAIKVKKELIKFNLIEDIRVGLNKPNKIYILNINYLECIDNTRKSENRNSKSKEIETLKVRKSNSNKTNINKTNINKTENNNNTEITNISNKSDKTNKNNENETNNIKNEIEKTIGCEVNIEVLKKTIKKNNLLLDDIRYYLANWHKFDYKTKDNQVGYFLTLVTTKAVIPKGKQGFTKPDQSYNFEQRVYDDEYFDSLYDNFRP